MPELMDGLSMNIEQTNLDKLRSVFPECVSEGKLDIDKLLSLCGEYIDNDFEKYKFEWKGKADWPAAGSEAIHRHPASLPGGKRGLGHHPEPLYRGRQPGGLEAAANGLLPQGKDDLY